MKEKEPQKPKTKTQEGKASGPRWDPGQPRREADANHNQLGKCLIFGRVYGGGWGGEVKVSLSVRGENLGVKKGAQEGKKKQNCEKTENCF